jgi:MoaA/NifB/PqqE/SkfB family radical SAM enzyme
MESKTFCVNPYMNLSVHPKGTVKPCCMSNKDLVTDTGEQTLAEASILQFWNSKDRQQMIADLNSGIEISECNSCWNEERAGKNSKRIRDNAIYKDKITEDMLPLVVDLSMGNLCNLKCRICSPTHSSPWMIEESEIQFPGNKKQFLDQPRWAIAKQSFDHDNAYFWDDIETLLPNVVKFDFAGGEPFYIEKHWDIIKKCVDNGWSKNQHIHYNTNGTIYPEKYMHLLEEFKFVDIQVSSDGVGKKFEYMRHPANWITSEQTIDKLIDAKRSSKTDWLLSVCISVSAFNVFDFFETFEHYSNKGIGIYINVVHDHHGTRILPPELKKIIINKLQSYTSSNRQWKNECEMICRHLENSTYNDYDWLNFWKEIKMRDQIRKESFEETFPEYYGHLKNYVEK